MCLTDDQADEIEPAVPIPMDKLAWMQQEMIKLVRIQKAFDLGKMVGTSIGAAARDILNAATR